jgi:hypothetical protein
LNNKIISFGNKAYVAGLFMVAYSMALSKFGMSLGQFFILGGWLLSANFSDKWQQLKSNKMAQRGRPRKKCSYNQYCKKEQWSHCN